MCALSKSLRVVQKIDIGSTLAHEWFRESKALRQQAGCL